MKRNILLGVVLVLILLVGAQPASSQTFRLIQKLWSDQAVRLATSDSIEVQLVASGPEADRYGFAGAWPDSVKLSWNGKGPGVTTSIDSIAVYFRVSGRQAPGAYVYDTGTLVDSIKAEETDFYNIPTTYWRSRDYLKVGMAGTVPANPAISNNSKDATPTRFSARLELFYSK